MNYPTQTLIVLRDPDKQEYDDGDVDEMVLIMEWLKQMLFNISAARVISPARNWPYYGDTLAKTLGAKNERYETLEPEDGHPIHPVNILKFFDKRNGPDGEPLYPSCEVAVVTIGKKYAQPFPKDLALKLFGFDSREVDITKGQPTTDEYGWFIHLDLKLIQGIKQTLCGG